VEKDPIGVEGGTTGLYEYVGGRVVDRVDPTGTNPAAIGAAIAACFASGVCEAAAVAAAEAGFALAAGAATALAARRFQARQRPAAQECPRTDDPLPPIPKPPLDCDAVRNYCVQVVCQPHLDVDPLDQGIPFRNCVQECLGDYGC
jgi:hypothetical protein